MYKIRLSSKFRKDFKLCKRRGLKLPLLEDVVDMLSEWKVLPHKYQDHPLTGNYAGYRECHISPDWLLIYAKYDEELILVLLRTGSHSDLF